jgi:class 3 adenylate cyclase
VVTVLFADLVDFTALSERLDPEDVATIQEAYFRRARLAIERNLGSVEKFIGDAVVGSFGVAHAGADDAMRAVHAARRIIEAVDEVARELGIEPGVLRIRVGVNTGEVLVTTEDDGGWRLTGDPVNVTARLQAAARPGRVLVGPDTALAVETGFVLRSAGELELKGKDRRVPAWEVVETRAPSPTTAAPTGASGPFVGREDELRMLDSMLGADPAARAWLVVAPPGAGRTRLVSEWGARALARGFPVWPTGSVASLSGYEPVMRLLRIAIGLDPVPAAIEEPIDRRVLEDRLVRAGHAGPRAELAVDHAAALLDGGGMGGGGLGGKPADLFDSWVAVLDAYGRGPRPIWIVDDVHAASPDVIAFLRHALAYHGDADRAILLTASPVLLTASGPDPFPATRVLQLEPLPDRAIRRLLDAGVHGVGLPPSIADRVLAAANGNPLFVEELLRVWVQTGVLARTSDGGWTFEPVSDELHVPATVQSIYQSDLDALELAARQVLTVGSIPGLSFPSASLAALGVAHSATPLSELTDVGLLLGPHEGVARLPAYTYHHGLLRDVAYSMLTRNQRASLHLRFASWLEEMAPGTDADALVGLQLAAAHANATAFGRLEDGRSRDDVAEAAAERLDRAAVRRLASEPEAAGELAVMALELTSPHQLPERRRRQLVVAESHRRSGRMVEAMRAFSDAARAAEPSEPAPDVDTLVGAALGYEEALFASRLPRDEWGQTGIDLLTRAVEAVGSSAEPLRARLLAALGRARVYRGEDGSAMCRDAVALAREAGDPAALAHALLALRAAQTEPEDLPDRIAAGLEIVAAARRAGDAETEFEGLRLRLIDLLEAKEIDDAEEVGRRASDVAFELRQPQYLWYPAMWAAMRALFLGELDDAADLIERFDRHGRRWHYRDVALVHAVQAMHLHIERGEPDRGLAQLEPLERENPNRFWPTAAYAYACAGRLDEARHRLSGLAERHFADLPRDLSRVYVSCLLVECAAAVDDPVAARALAAIVEPWLGHGVVLGSGAIFLGSASYFLGLARAAAGDNDGAAAALVQAVDENRAMGGQPALARAEQMLARVRA